jgi:Hemerythrin HHE cation binding domain
MAPPHAAQLADQADWALMSAIHDALRRDLDQLLHGAASHASARARWGTFRSQLRFHLAAEHTAMWPQVTAKLTDHPHGRALLDALDDERQLLGPLQAMIDDALTMDPDPGRLRQLLARLHTRLDSHLAHEEADALPLISQILSPGELGGLAAAIRGGHSIRRAGTTLPWALTGASPDIRQHILSQLPAPARLLYRTIWLPRHARTTPAL